MFPTTNDLLEKQIAIIVEQRSRENSHPFTPLVTSPGWSHLFSLLSDLWGLLIILPKLPSPGKEPVLPEVSEGVTVCRTHLGNGGLGPMSFACGRPGTGVHISVSPSVSGRTVVT